MLLDRGSITFADAPFFCHTSQGYILRQTFVEISVVAVVVNRMLTSDKPNERTVEQFPFARSQYLYYYMYIIITFIPISHAKTVRCSFVRCSLK